MKNTPILFSTPMVLAILDDIKSQTRREVKGPDPKDTFIHSTNGIWYSFMPFGETKSKYIFNIKNPYGNAGDKLWVRETVSKHTVNGKYVYKASIDNLLPEEKQGIIWKPSIHMEAWQARIFLTICNIRVERLLDISDLDAMAEGIKEYSKDGIVSKYWINESLSWNDMPRSPREAYFKLWDEINGKDSHKKNPWVWVITFIK